MTLKEYNEKRDRLKAEGRKLAKEGKLEEAKAKQKEIEELDAAFQEEKDRRAEENAMDDKVTPEMLRNETVTGEENEMPNMHDASSREYRNAFLKHISGRDDQMTKLENDAYVHTTSTTPNVLPTTMLEQIWDLVSQNHTIVADLTRYTTGTILEVARHTAITAGAAAEVDEGVANEDEQNTFTKVTLSGKDFSKTVRISYAEAAMSLDALENYLISEISSSLGDALAADTVSVLEGGSSDTTYGIASANMISAATAGTLAYTDVLGAFGQLKRVVNPVVYCTRATLFNYVAALTDAAGHLIYQPGMTANVPGILLGAQVKIEDAVDDGKLLIGDPKKIVDNVITDILVESDKDIATHTYIYSGYARRQCGLIDDLAFVELDINGSSAG